MEEVAWFLYLLSAADDRATYVGISTDPKDRLRAHNGERAGGARSTRRGRPWELLGIWGPYESRGEAQRAEAALKGLSAAERRACLRGRKAESAPWCGKDFLENRPQIH